MRRLLVTLFAGVVVAACSSNAPSETPIQPWSPASDAPTPTAGTARACAGSTDPTSWIDFAPAGEGFSVRLPASPDAQTSTVPVEGGNATVTSWSCASGSDTGLAVIHVKGNFPDSADQVLDSAVQVMASQSNATIKSKSAITVDGHPGVAVVLTGQGVYIDGELVLAGGDLFGVYVVGAAAPADNSLAQAFFASLKITE